MLFSHFVRVPTAIAVRTDKERRGVHFSHLTGNVSSAFFISTRSRYHARKRMDVNPTASTGAIPYKRRLA